ncbi:hypothetical protein RQM59_05110 [Flavobacteriaceae bacterium S356]|uniref:Uncharacterized protein n=1 Tax=Asprobacillus argus TaxID=3076534 RepID=A0ABU3LF94_9FLAO|nr:hypothetical protein [Flavobacteriaceae bacterium S356]
MTTDSNKPGAAFWVIGAIALIWNGFGVLNYIGQAYMTDEMKDALPEFQRELIENRPAWATAAFAIAVFGGALGSLLLLMRKKLSYTLFVLSFLGVLIQMVNDVFMSNSIGNYGPGGVVMVLLIPSFCIFLIFYAKKARSKGWLS